MWQVGCLESSQTHVEEKTRDRLLKAARDMQESITMEEAKEKVLEIMRRCDNKDSLNIDPQTNLEKYWLRELLPGSQNIWLDLCIIEDKTNNTRKIKTLITNWDRLNPDWIR